MILVRNPLPLLNGNNIIVNVLIGVIFCFGLFGCDPSKKTRTTDRDRKSDEERLEEIIGEKKYNPETGKYEYESVSEAEMDTIRWIKIQDRTPIRHIVIKEKPAEFEVKTTLKDQYKLALLIPFMTNRIDLETEEIRGSFTPPLHFYAGMKLALEEYNGPQTLEVEVLDTRLYPGEVSKLAARPSVKQADMIIGPWRSDNIKIIARVGQEEEIPFVSPIYPSNAILSQNPFHIQVNPSLETHARAIIGFAEERFPVSNIVLVERKTSFLQTFQNAHQALAQSMEVDSLSELVLSDDPSEWKEEDFKNLIRPFETTVFIIPATSHSDETFVHNVLRHIDLAREEENVVVMGMPAWASYDKISYDYFEKLNVHISTAYYINRQSPRTHQFRKKYFEKYGVLPLEEAYKGYDIMEYFVRMIRKHGTRFQYWLDEEPMDALHTRFEFEQIVPPDAIVEEDYSQAERFENRFVQILEFEDYIFSPVK